jgi:hypothetical protein
MRRLMLSGCSAFTTNELVSSSWSKRENIWNVTVLEEIIIGIFPSKIK